MNDSLATFVTWNVGNPSEEELIEDLRDLVTTLAPYAFSLQEVADRKELLEAFCAETGYQLVHLRVGPHSTSVAVLLRGDLPLETADWFLMTPRSFVGRKVAGSRRTGWTKPKGTVWIRTNFWDAKWIVASTHLTPSHQVLRARLLARVQVSALAAWMRIRPRAVLLGGDFNESPNSKFGTLAPLKLISTCYSARSFGNRVIDMWWVVQKHLDKLSITASVQSLDGYSSDHRPVVLTLSRTIAPVEEHSCPVCGLMHLPPVA